MAYVMNLKAEDFYTQRNNQWDDPRTPHHERIEACMPTTRVMFYKGNRITFDNPSDLADDDFFMKTLRSDMAYEYAEKHFPGLAHDYPPNQIHGMYQWLDEVVCGHCLSIFNDKGLTFKKAMSYVKDGKCLMVSGRFEEAGLNGHAFLIAGYFNDDLLIADPWGDYRNNYKPIMTDRGKAKYGGFGVVMNESDFNKILKWGETKAYHEPI